MSQRKMSGMFVLVLFCVFSFCCAILPTDDDESYSSGRGRGVEICGPNATGIEWIISQRDENYGWGLQTHRAIIAVFIGLHEGKTYVTQPERRLMVNQLEVELSLALLRNSTGLTLPQSELSLFIHALLVVGRNPKNFKGINLVKILEKKMVDINTIAHPFTALCLCNVGSLKLNHLQRIRVFLDEPGFNAATSAVELNAIALKAFACAEPEMIKIFEPQMEKTADFLASYQKEDGSFGNPFTTSMVVQALRAMDRKRGHVVDAVEFLGEQQSSNLVTIYYIGMALQKAVFVKDYRQNDTALIEAELDELDRGNSVFVTYSLKVGYLPDSYITISMHVPKYSTMFDVMKLASKENAQFEFLHSLLKNDDSLVYSISGLPNNAEDGLYWMLQRGLKNDNDKNTRLYELTEPVNRIPISDNGEYVFEYRNLFTQT